MRAPKEHRLGSGLERRTWRRDIARQCWTRHAWTEWADEGTLDLLQSRFCLKCGGWGLRRSDPATARRVCLPSSPATA